MRAAAPMAILVFCLAPVSPLGAQSRPVSEAPGGFAVLQSAPPREVAGLAQLYREICPPLRGFRATIPGVTDEPWPFDEPGIDSPVSVRKAAEFVGRRLAFDGLLATTVRVIEMLGADRFAGNDANAIGLLKEAGLPVDLLRHFEFDAGASSPDIVRELARRLGAKPDPTAVIQSLAQARFQFQPSRPGFRAAADTGEDEIGMFRIQVATGRYFQGPGDGSTLDVARQLIRACPQAGFQISVPHEHLNAVLHRAEGWNVERPSRCTFIPAAHSLSQWAQDNGKPGWVEGKIATIVPRFASRGEEGSTFVPGDSLVFAAIARSGHVVVQSPLVFQGGDLIVLKDPKGDGRTLLIGEGEIYRNTALGLTREQVMEAFRVEFGVDRCIVLPAASYHIDYEVSVRSHDGSWFAFVNDSQPAMRIILQEGLNALLRHNAAGVDEIKTAFDAMSTGQFGVPYGLIQSLLARHARGDGQFPESLAKGFSTGPADSGVGNFQRFLLAVDLLRARAGIAGWADDPATSAYQQALARRDRDRASLVTTLTQLDCRIVPIPSLAEEGRSTNYLNGIHYRGGYLMPAQGGLFAPLDDAARSAFQTALGPGIKVTPILSAESQRRVGAVRCSASAYPK